MEQELEKESEALSQMHPAAASHENLVGPSVKDPEAS